MGFLRGVTPRSAATLLPGVPAEVVMTQAVGVFLGVAAGGGGGGGVGEVVLVGVLVAPPLAGVAVDGVVQLASVVTAVFVT